MKKYGFRITKYNPKNRNKLGHYTVDEWTSISDIKKYNISWNEYLKVENTYVDMLTKLLTQFNYNKLKIIGLEKSFKWKEFSKLEIKGLGKIGKTLYKNIINNRQESLNLSEISIFTKFLLREMLWCFLYGEKIEIKTGYDYYMYILTSNKDIADYLRQIKDDILYIEEVDLSFFEKDEDWIKSSGYNEEHFYS